MYSRRSCTKTPRNDFAYVWSEHLYACSRKHIPNFEKNEEIEKIKSKKTERKDKIKMTCISQTKGRSEEWLRLWLINWVGLKKNEIRKNFRLRWKTEYFRAWPFSSVSAASLVTRKRTFFLHRIRKVAAFMILEFLICLNHEAASGFFADKRHFLNSTGFWRSD